MLLFFYRKLLIRMADIKTVSITRTELEKLLNFVKWEMESKMVNLTGLL